MGTCSSRKRKAMVRFVRLIYVFTSVFLSLAWAPSPPSRTPIPPSFSILCVLHHLTPSRRASLVLLLLLLLSIFGSLFPSPLLRAASATSGPNACATSTCTPPY